MLKQLLLPACAMLLVVSQTGKADVGPGEDYASPLSEDAHLVAKITYEKEQSAGPGRVLTTTRILTVFADGRIETSRLKSVKSTTEASPNARLLTPNARISRTGGAVDSLDRPERIDPKAIPAFMGLLKDLAEGRAGARSRGADCGSSEVKASVAIQLADHESGTLLEDSLREAGRIDQSCIEALGAINDFLNGSVRLK
jgi:hypothetical protein